MIKNLKIWSHKKLVSRFSQLNRLSIANYYLSGDGMEIGAMECPLIPKNASRIIYLDRCTSEDSEIIFPELKNKLVKVNIVDDAEQLTLVENESFDFVIANHFLEHTENPILTLKNILRVLKSGGKIFLALPDKDYTFDYKRELTTFEHLCQDFEKGPLESRMDHYFDFVKNTEHGEGKTDSEIEKIIQELIDSNFSIHYHVWNHQSYIDFFTKCNVHYNLSYSIIFSKSSISENDNESIFILKKND